MVAIVIQRKLSAKELDQVREMLAGEACDIYSDKVADLPFKTQQEVRLKEEGKKNINFRLMNLLVRFGDMPAGQSSVTDSLAFDRTSMWYYHKYRVFFDLQQIFYKAEELSNYCSHYDIVYCYCEPFPKELEILLPSCLRLIAPDDLPGRMSGRLNFFLAYMRMLVKRSFQKADEPESRKHCRHVVMDLSLWQPMLKMKSLEVEKGNYIFGYLYRKLGKEFLVINESVQPNMKICLDLKDVKGWKGDSSLIFSESIIIKGFLKFWLPWKAIRLYKQLGDKLKKMEISQFEPEAKAMYGVLVRSYGSSLYYLLRYMIYDDYFRRNPFKTITTTDENSPATRSVLDAARKNGIRTLGVQHGTIHALHPAYMYSVKDRDRGGMPDHTLVWGTYYKDLLVNSGNYDAASIEVTGQIRTDIIPELMLRQETIVRAANRERIIVFASQPQQDPGLRRRAAEDVFMAVKGLEDTRLIIKLHPAEQDPGYYTRIAQEKGVGNYGFGGESDLYMIISQSFAVITCFSTVGMEVAYFRKPLIVLDHLRQDIQNYCKEGVGLQATDSHELRNVLQLLLEGKISIPDEVYERFIGKYAYRIDGQAAERTKRFISSFS